MRTTAERPSADLLRSLRRKWETVVDDIDELRRKGLSWDDIANALGVSPQVLRRALADT